MEGTREYDNNYYETITARDYTARYGERESTWLIHPTQLGVVVAFEPSDQLT